MTMTTRATGFIGLLNDSMELVGEVQQCEVSWTQGPGSWEISFLTNHHLEPNGKQVSFVGLMHGGTSQVE